MPTYEYQCLKCKKKFEEVQKITAGALKKCITCGGRVERLISAGTGFIFKGSGFYSTDYKKKAPADPSTVPAPAKAVPRHTEGGQASSGGKGESTSGGKAEPKKEKTNEK